jgi:hypothetical protein
MDGMTVVYFDSTMGDDERRVHLFAGDIFVYSPTASSLELCAFAREMATEAFAPHDPRDAQHHLDRQHFVDVLAKLKPEFIHHPRSKKLLCAIVSELGADPAQTYFDVPRLRTMTSEYLNAGLALQFEPHRDTWFANPFCQVNWWIPMYEVAENNVMAFHPRYFSNGVRNSSQIYDYGEWLANGRVTAANQVEQDTRKRSALEQEIEMEPDLRVITPPAGVMVFSGAQLHTTIPNTSGRTRFSIDFRTVHRRDVERGDGATNVDSEATGTTLGDFMRVSDLTPLPTELVDGYPRLNVLAAG